MIFGDTHSRLNKPELRQERRICLIVKNFTSTFSDFFERAGLGLKKPRQRKIGARIPALRPARAVAAN
jgi:hypothetical protein